MCFKKSMGLSASVPYNKWPKIKILELFGNDNVREFWKYHSCRFWAIFGDFRAFGVKIAIIKKQKLLLSTFKQFSLYYYGDVYAESSKIDKNRPKSRWVVFLEFSDFAISIKPRFFDLMPFILKYTGTSIYQIFWIHPLLKAI